MSENASLAALKPCPFCGHPPVLRPIKNDGRWIADCNTVTCIRPTTGLRRTEAEAVTAWNTRAADQRCSELEAENARLRGAVIDAGASLAAAISLLERGGKAAKKAAPSDKMFDQMLVDYKASLARFRAALGENTDG